MGCYYVIGLRVDHRRANAAGLQETLTRYGCNIRLRVGLHEAGEGRCSDDGVILLQVCGEQERGGPPDGRAGEHPRGDGEADGPQLA